MGYGDEILAAGQAQRHFDQTGERSIIVDRDGKPRWHPIWEGNPVIVRPGDDRPGDHIIVNAAHVRPYINYPFTIASGWNFNKSFHARENVATIYLTDDELYLGREAHVKWGPFVLIDPWSKHENLRWPIGHWQQLVNSRRDLRWVQHVYTGVPLLAGVELVETPSFRDACGVLASASLYVRGESGMCHAAAALGIPQVTIWGGCMDWDVLGNYPKQFGLVSDNGPCGRYAPCLHCERVMHQISPALVSGAISAQLELHGVR